MTRTDLRLWLVERNPASIGMDEYGSVVVVATHEAQAVGVALVRLKTRTVTVRHLGEAAPSFDEPCIVHEAFHAG